MTKSEKYNVIKENVHITDYAREMGYTVVKKGKYYSLKEHDSVMIDPYRNCYWRNSVPGRTTAIGKGGSIIDFVMDFDNLTLAEALKILEKRIVGYIPAKKNVVSIKQCPEQLILPEKADNMRMVFAYLTKTRCISQRVVQDFVNRKMLYQDKHNNCVFVGYDIADKDNAVFACKRGTNTYKPFYGDVLGCDYTKCIYEDNEKEELIITESVIDAMSLMTLMGDTYKQYNYLILGGAGKWDAIKSYIDEAMKKVYIATDNDEAGRNAAQFICNYISEQRPDVIRKWKLPDERIGKDWNNVLQERVKKYGN